MYLAPTYISDVITAHVANSCEARVREYEEWQERSHLDSKLELASSRSDQSFIFRLLCTTL
ncbi:hypothetical protein GN958_ATG18642 [Phytophthora infestans]|uniref:Uncharacterized protein n=1 Tax=Phytophthora infestans TaxID=4787 RepID=A0A8S9TXC6_PHYIN|nr:hypothetical protein GN958_ATG18642 [Phytophthora infestans]